MLVSTSNIVAIVTSFLLFAGPAAASIATPRRVGGINVGQACLDQHSEGSGATCSGDVYNWKCKNTGFGVNMNEACRVQYRHKKTFQLHAGTTGNGYNGWGCFNSK